MQPAQRNNLEERRPLLQPYINILVELMLVTLVLHGGYWSALCSGHFITWGEKKPEGYDTYTY